MVIVCGTFQFWGVKVSAGGVTVPSRELDLKSGIVTSAVGGSGSTTGTVALPPASLVKSGPCGVIVMTGAVTIRQGENSDVGAKRPSSRFSESAAVAVMLCPAATPGSVTANVALP